MLHYFSADWIFPVTQPPLKNGVVSINEHGFIEQLFSAEEADSLDFSNIKRYEGAIVPGFINTHCHLELSHMKGMIPMHTGLVNFVENILKNRQSNAGSVQSAMEKADNEMYLNGIVAVGDISNNTLSKAVKLNSKLYYHTFKEVLGFNPASADKAIQSAKILRKDFAPLSSSIAPHAPYTVSSQLLSLIAHSADEFNGILSIHNQETIAENEFFLTKTGDFIKLYETLGLNIDFFDPSGMTSLRSYLPQLGDKKTLLVHNTFTSKEDLDYATGLNPNLYWCICPSANLYIENNLPNVKQFFQSCAKVTLGTDSLASNQQLNIVSEMMILQKEQHLDFHELLKCATINGAEFLGKDNVLGSIDVGKIPGLNLIKLDKDLKIVSDKVLKLL